MTVALAPTAPVRPVATLALAGIAFAALMDVVNCTILSISREQMIGGTHATPDEFAWVNLAYLMAKLVMFPLAGWTVVRFGARQPLLWSVCLLIGVSAATRCPGRGCSSSTCRSVRSACAPFWAGSTRCPTSAGRRASTP